MVYTLSKSDIERQLGRPLSETEADNLEALVALAKQRLEQALNAPIDGDGARTFASCERARQLYIGPFTELKSVKVNDKLLPDGYEVMWSDEFRVPANSLRFSKPMVSDRIVKIEATWGFGAKLPLPLLHLWAQLFDAIARMSFAARDDNGRLIRDITAEKIIDYSVTYAKSSQSDLDRVLSDNMGVISAYRTPSNTIIPSGVEGCI